MVEGIVLIESEHGSTHSPACDLDRSDGGTMSVHRGCRARLVLD
jgi:hypothetical protein